MKNLLLTLSSISTLTIVGNVVLTTKFTQYNNATCVQNIIVPSVATDSQVFNNEYQKLNNNDWITNQSKTDDKYYSYDTTHADYLLSDKSSARNAFQVDDTGELVIKKNDKYSYIDYNNLNNTKDEIIAHRKVTTMNRLLDHAYTGSEYRNDIFTGDSTNWKFLQESQVENHVDIHDVSSAEKVSDNTNLSEGLGLYYISKADLTKDKKNLLDPYLTLARTFMNRTVLQTSVPDEVLAGIINTFVSSPNNAAMQYMNSLPYNNADYNDYATNYILDSSNQVVAIFYEKYESQYNIKNLNLKFDQQVISVKDPAEKSVKDIESLIKQKIVDSFKSQLADKVKITPADIDDKYFTIQFSNEEATQSFEKNIDVNYTISTNWQAANHFNFAGTYNGTIPVINKLVQLSAEEKLKTLIESKYISTTDESKWLNVKIENKQHDNFDDNLTADGVASANAQISDIIKKDVSDYFKANDADIKIQDSDYTISTDLKPNDKLFNQKNGKDVDVTIKATDGQFRVSDQLSNIKVTVHGKNTDFINVTREAVTTDIDGIKQVDHEDSDVLQDNEHFYEQPALLKFLVDESKSVNSKDNKDLSLLNTIKNNAYNVDSNSFTGNFTISYQLEDADKKTVSFSIDTNAITADGGSEKNLWDVLNKTKMIWLHTSVIHHDNDRTLNLVSLAFTSSSNPNDKPLCVFDMSNQFNNISISSGAKLKFPDFQFNISYQQMS